MREKIRKWAPPVITIAITIFIFFMSSRPAVQSDEISLETTKTAVGIWSLLPFFNWSAESMQELAYVLNPIMRKVAHFVEFAVLGMSAFMWMRGWIICEKLWVRFVLSFGYCVIIASLDETLQLFVEGRWGSVSDVLLDSTGAVGGIILLICFEKIWKNMVLNKNRIDRQYRGNMVK